MVVEATTWDVFPTLWPRLLDTVWAAVRSDAGITTNRNVMLYKDDVPNVEVGVEVAEPFPDLGRVASSCLPVGRAAMTLITGATTISARPTERSSSGAIGTAFSESGRVGRSTGTGERARPTGT